MARISALAWIGVAGLGLCAQELEFGPKQGTRLVKSFESSLELRLEELTLQLESTPQPTSLLWADISIGEERRTVLIDEHSGSVEAPTLLRKFELLEIRETLDAVNRTSAGGAYSTCAGRSRLEGERVQFAGRTQQSAGSVSFVGEGPRDKELLEGLEEDVDFHAFLPSVAQQAAKTWSVDAAALRTFFQPGGLIDYVSEMGDAVQSVFPGPADSFEGPLRVEFGGSRDLAEGKFAVLRISGTSTVTMAPIESEGQVQFGRGYTDPGTNTVRASLELEVSGEILWDRESRHVQSAWLAADVVVKRETHGRTSNPPSESWVRDTWHGCLRTDARVTKP